MERCLQCQHDCVYYDTGQCTAAATRRRDCIVSEILDAALRRLAAADTWVYLLAFTTQNGW